MYRTFYSFSKEPFSKEISANDIFLSGSFKEGSARLEYLKSSRGMGIITGEPGCGKTTLLRKFAASLSQTLFKVIYFPLSTVTVNDFYRGIAYGLGEEPRFRKVDIFAQIQQAVMNLYFNQKITPVFILDEMHMASGNFLNDIGLLFNFRMDSENPFILCMCGLPHLADKLKLSQMQPLNQRIIIKHRMVPLTKDEVGEYIDFHLKNAGCSSPLFTPDAVEAIASKSRCYPRLINNIAIHTLNYGCAKKLETLDCEAVYAAATDLEI
jgi:Type II secretory pathway, component ExeA (predicted ATPase)